LSAEEAVALWVLALFGLYLIVGFCLRTLIQRRQTGSTGLKGVRGKTLSIAWIAAAALGLGALTGISGPVLDLTGVIHPLSAFDSDLGHKVGILLFVSGLAVMFYSQLTMGSSWRVGVDPNERSVLITQGPFSFVRNPIYSAAAVMSIALILILPNILMICSFVTQFIGIELQVRGVEEPYLLKNHDRQYREYAGRVGRLVPFVGRLR
jgi:protein-S-isoprenylcysteine O-methyltransferase Ste14